MPLYSFTAVRVIEVATVSYKLIELLLIYNKHASLMVLVLLVVTIEAASLMTQFMLAVVLCYRGGDERSCP